MVINRYSNQTQFFFLRWRRVINTANRKLFCSLLLWVWPSMGQHGSMSILTTCSSIIFMAKHYPVDWMTCSDKLKPGEVTPGISTFATVYPLPTCRIVEPINLYEPWIGKFRLLDDNVRCRRYCPSISTTKRTIFRLYAHESCATKCIHCHVEKKKIRRWINKGIVFFGHGNWVDTPDSVVVVDLRIKSRSSIPP